MVPTAFFEPNTALHTNEAWFEIGVDYTTYNFSATSMGVYARTGTVIWGGDRSASWHVSGGLNFRF